MEEVMHPDYVPPKPDPPSNVAFADGEDALDDDAEENGSHMDPDALTDEDPADTTESEVEI